MANERWPVLTPAGKVNKKSPSSRGFHLSQEITRNQRAMAQQQYIEQQQWYRTATGINHISAKQSYVTRLFLSTLALALITVVPRHRPEFAILSTAPLNGVTLWNIWIRQGVANAWLIVR